MVNGQYSDFSCNEACWYAKEDICRCICAGANHGLYKRDPNAPQPQREMRVKSKRYKLYAVSSRFDSYSIQRAFYNYNRTPFEGREWWNHPAGDVVVRRATEAQVLNWPEVKPFFTNLHKAKVEGVVLAMGDVEPYLIWIPIELTSEWLDEHPIEYTPSLERKSKTSVNSSI